MARGKIRWSSDTIPHLLTVFLGLLITYQYSLLAGLAYTGIVIIGMLWFWWGICTRCRAYGHPACPSGYGIIASKLFKRRKGDFARSFRRNIISVTFQWFVPLALGVRNMLFDPDPQEITLLALFCLVAFVYLPLAAKRKGCSTCPQKKECPFKR